MKTNNWDMKNQLKLKGDSIISPIKAILTEINKASQKIYSLKKSERHEWLYLIEY